MNNKIVLTLLLFVSSITACSSQYSSPLDLKNELIQKLINDPEVQSVKTNGKILILKTRYCKDFDCKVYFQDYEKQIQVYSKEEAFMNPEGTYLAVEDLDEANGQIMLWISTKREYKEIKIQ